MLQIFETAAMMSLFYKVEKSIAAVTNSRTKLAAHALFQGSPVGAATSGACVGVWLPYTSKISTRLLERATGGIVRCAFFGLGGLAFIHRRIENEYKRRLSGGRRRRSCVGTGMMEGLHTALEPNLV